MRTTVFVTFAIVLTVLMLAAVAHGATYREVCLKAYGNDGRAVAACTAMTREVGRGRRVVVDTE